MERGDTFSKMNWKLLSVGRHLLAAAFLVAGALKWKNPAAFAESIAAFKILPTEWSNIVAILLPAVEIALGGLLLFGPWKRAASLGVMLASVFFTALLAQAWLRGMPLDCGCFGKWDPAAGHPIIAVSRDVIFAFVAFFSYHDFRRRPQSSSS